MKDIPCISDRLVALQGSFSTDINGMHSFSFRKNGKKFLFTWSDRLGQKYNTLYVDGKCYYKLTPEDKVRLQWKIEEIRRRLLREILDDLEKETECHSNTSTGTPGRLSGLFRKFSSFLATIRNAKA